MVEIFDASAASTYGLVENDAVMTIHCGSRGLVHQIGAEFMRPIQDNLAAQGILVRSPSTRGIAEKTPGAHEDVGDVVAVAEQTG